MDKLTKHLVDLANRLDQENNIKCADVIDSLIENKSAIKVAQYVGVIGYVLKQNRAMGNCIRKKRVASNESMQTVVLECLKEYQDGQEYGNNDWTSKYAQVIKQVPESFNNSHIAFLEAVEKENELSYHCNQIKKAHSILSNHNIKDEFLDNLVADINILKC